MEEARRLSVAAEKPSAAPDLTDNSHTHPPPVQSDDVPWDESDNESLAQENTAAPEPSFQRQEEEFSHPPVVANPTTTTSLPPLSAENWPDIVQALTAELGVAVWTAQHATYIATENNHIVLAFHADADTHIQTERLKELGETLARHYGTHAKLKTTPWQENYASARQIKQQRAEAAQQTALSILHSDPQAQRIQNTFGGQWLPDSVKLRH